MGPNAGPPAAPGGLSPNAMRRLYFHAWLWAPAVSLVAVLYRGGLTVGALFVGLGWVSFALAAWQIGRAALAFDVAPDAELPEDVDATRRTELQQEKKILLKAIKEIEFDHEMGKIDDEDAAEITKTYRARAIEILRLLDENKSIDYQAVVEKEVARRLAKAGGASARALPVAAASETDEPAAAEAAPAEAGVCPACSTKNDADAVFCKKCAARLSS